MRDLSHKDYDLLWGVYHFGGYCNSYSATLATGISRRKTFDRLKTLVERSYLRKVLIDFRRTTPHVFQVTRKTCRLFHNPNSNLRKNHSGDYIIRALLRYLFYIEHRRLPFIVSNEDKIKTFQDMGYSREMVPCKENLSKRKTQSSRVYWIEELVVSHNALIHLFFIDRDPRNAYSQLRVMLKSYERILGHDHKKIRFYIVVANDWRKRQYLRVIKRGLIFSVDRPDGSKVENYDQLLDRLTSTRRTPEDHLSLRDIDLKILQTKTDIFVREPGR
jgi:hypothetical protein